MGQAYHLSENPPNAGRAIGAGPLYPAAMVDLFADDLPAPGEPPLREDAPLADRLRPATLADVVGQEHLTGPEGARGRMVAAGRLPSMIM